MIFTQMTNTVTYPGCLIASCKNGDLILIDYPILQEHESLIEIIQSDYYLGESNEFSLNEIGIYKADIVAVYTKDNTPDYNDCDVDFRLENIIKIEIEKINTIPTS